LDRVRTNILAELAGEAALNEGERARLRCRLAKRLEGAGAYEEARELLRPFWPRLGERPATEGLDDEAAASLLLHAGVITRWIGGDTRVEHAHEAAKDLISESLSLFERLRLAQSAAEAQVELAYCYWHEGAVDEARVLLREAVSRLGEGGGEVKALAVLRLALVEDSATRYSEGYRILKEHAALFESLDSHLLRGGFHNELATVYHHLGSVENRDDYLDRALVEYTASIFHLEQAGHARYQAHVENNIGLFFHMLGRNEEAHEHLDRARELFASLGDRVFAAQVDETRARVLLTQGRAAEAERLVRDAAEVFERAGGHALLAEALTTRGRALARLKRFEEARADFARAEGVAEQAGNAEGAGLASLTMIEELAPLLGADEMREGYLRADERLARTQDPEVSERLRLAARRLLDALPEIKRAEAARPPARAARAAQPDALGDDPEVRAAVEGFISDALKRHGERVEFTREAVEAMSGMFLEDGLRTLEAIIEETVAAAPRGTIVTADDVEVVALRRALPRGNFAEPWSGFSLKEELRQPERRFIELALKASDGKISVAARLLGFNHNEILTSIIKSRYPELLAARKPPIPRRRSIINKPRKPKTPKR
jgi:tetratricopeptide (TPR) repeat protein